MSQLPTLSTNHVPVGIAPDLDRTLSILSNALEGGRTLPANRQLAPALRERLEIRVDVLAGWLAPIGPTEARVMVAALLMVLPGQGSRGSVEDAERVQGLYVRALADVPRFALRAACSAALTRGVGGKKFAPSPAELRAEAEQEAHRWRAEADKIRRVLEAKLEAPRSTEEVRKASAAAARKLFGLPVGGIGQRAAVASSAHEFAVEDKGHLANVAKDIFLGSSMDAWKRKQAAKSGAAYPDDRFDDEHAA